MSIILDGFVNKDYEPSEDELIEYGKWLGMKFPDDKPFLWIAREGLKAPLPEGWKACRSEKGDLYYFNFKTGESIWDHPLDNQFKELLQKEKENPTFKSLANGAKRLSSQPDAGGENVIDATKPKEKRINLFEGRSKIGALKSLKSKKLSPDGLSSELTDISESGLDSKGSNIEIIKSDKQSGIICHSILKPITNTLQTEKSEGFLTMEKNVYEAKLNEELRNFQIEKLKEHEAAKEDCKMRLKDLWSRHQERQKDEYDKKFIESKNNYEKMLLDERKKMREKYEENMQALSNDIAVEYEAETARIRQLLNERIEKEKTEVERKYQSELDEFKKNKKEELSRLRASERQIFESMKQSTKELAENTLAFVKTYKSAHDEFASVFVNANAMHVNLIKATLQHFIECAQNSYESEIKNIKDSFQFEVDQLRRKFVTEISAIQKGRNFLMEQQKKDGVEPDVSLDEQCTLQDGKTATISFAHLGQKNEKYHKNNDQTHGLGNRASHIEVGGEGAKYNDTLVGGRLEKDLLDSVVAIMKESQREEIEDVKRDIKLSLDKELRAVLNEVIQGRNHLIPGLSLEKSDEASHIQRLGDDVFFHQNVGERQLEEEKLTNNLLDVFQREDFTAALTEALRAVFAGSFILPSTFNSSAAFLPPGALASANRRQFCNAGTVVAPPATEAPIVDLEKNVDIFPASYREQKLLLAAERQRVAEVRNFVESQRLSLEERHFQLKVARHQWKQDVMAAKHKGVRPSSKMGQLLNKVRTALEGQAKALENDEKILRDNEKWLFVKEQNAQKLEQHIRELDEEKGGNTSFNSVDTVALTTSFFSPTAPLVPGLKTKNHDVTRGNIYKENLNVVYTKTLDKIARRLEEVASLMINQQQKRGTFLDRNGVSRYRMKRNTTKGTGSVFF